MALRPVQRIKNRPVTTKLCLCVLLSIFSFTLYRHETSRARAIADAGVGVAAARAAATTAGSARGGASARARAIAALVKAHGVERVEETIAATSTEYAPWFVVPADRKWVRDVAVANIVIDALERMDPQVPDEHEGLDDLVIE